MPEFFEHFPLIPLLKASAQASVLIILILIAQRVFKRRLSPRWRYLLWSLIVIRLALLTTVPSPLSLFNVLNLAARAPSAADTRTGTGARAPFLADATVAAVLNPNAASISAKGEVARAELPPAFA